MSYQAIMSVIGVAFALLFIAVFAALVWGLVQEHKKDKRRKLPHGVKPGFAEATTEKVVKK